MAYVVETTGKSVEEAILAALEELQCTRDEVEIEILSAPSKGLWGIIGSKDAKIKAWKRKGGAVEEAAGETAETEGGKQKEPLTDVSEAVAYTVPDADDKTGRFIMDVAGLMGIEASIGKKETEESILYTLNGPRMGAVIGRRGETLDALQYLSNIVAGKDRSIPRKRIVVDAEDYRLRREDTLVRLATRLAARAKKSGRRVVLEPMNPQERRVIHTALEKDPAVKSISEGEDPYRRLVIYPVGGENRGDGGRYNQAGSGSRSFRGNQFSRNRYDDDETEPENGEDS